MSSVAGHWRQAPGVHLLKNEFPDDFLPSSGVPIFLGYATTKDPKDPKKTAVLTNFHQFDSKFVPLPDGFLKPAVFGFFANGGGACYVMAMGTPGDGKTLESALVQVETLEAADLVLRRTS